jgi:predicted Zn finger-like uncharacterized protein
MSLATRCASCGTVFRVVQDQLKVSEGWVRCGRCDEVFNALEGLFDLERDAPPEWTGPTPAPELAHAGVSIVREPADEVPRDRLDPFRVERIDEQLLGPRRSAFGLLSSSAASARRQPDFADARFDTDLPEDAASVPVAATTSATGDSDDSAAHAAPEFVRRAQRQARWQSPWARALLLAGSCILALGLVTQAGHQFRDRIAAQWPASQPTFRVWCEFAGCAIGPPRRIEDISVESTALARATVADAFRLSIVLRNRASTPAAMPWIDLSLTDATGQLVARRALNPQDFRAHSQTLAAASESALQLLFSTGSARVTGYTVEIFYP